MILNLLVFLAACSSTSVYSEPVDLLLFTKPCPRNVDNLSDCLKPVLEKTWPHFADGVPDFKIPPMDPLTIDGAANSIQAGPVQGSFNISNLIVHGLSISKFLSVNAKLDNDHFHLELEIYHPTISYEMDYHVEGSFNVFIAHGQGHANLSVTDMTALTVLDGPVVNDRWNIETAKLKVIKIGDLRFWASDLFNGDKVFTEAALAFINQNWRNFYDLGVTVLQPLIDGWLKDIISKIAVQVPFSQVIP